MEGALEHSRRHLAPASPISIALEASWAPIPLKPRPCQALCGPKLSGRGSDWGFSPVTLFAFYHDVYINVRIEHISGSVWGRIRARLWRRIDRLQKCISLIADM